MTSPVLLSSFTFPRTLTPSCPQPRGKRVSERASSLPAQPTNRKPGLYKDQGASGGRGAGRGTCQGHPPGPAAGMKMGTLAGPTCLSGSNTVPPSLPRSRSWCNPASSKVCACILIHGKINPRGMKGRGWFCEKEPSEEPSDVSVPPYRTCGVGQQEGCRSRPYLCRPKSLQQNQGWAAGAFQSQEVSRGGMG